MTPSDGEIPPVDWSSGTFAGSEREQLRRWSRLTVRQKLQALDEMCALARRALAERQRRGLPYIDPDTGQAVQFAPMVQEDEAIRPRVDAVDTGNVSRPSDEDLERENDRLLGP
jgi:hypothetical protein